MATAIKTSNDKSSSLWLLDPGSSGSWFQKVSRRTWF